MDIINQNYINRTVKQALDEDLKPLGDVTSNSIDPNKYIKVRLISNQEAIIGGLGFAKQTFKLIDKKIEFITKKKEGSLVKKKI